MDMDVFGNGALGVVLKSLSTIKFFFICYLGFFFNKFGLA